MAGLGATAHPHLEQLHSAVLRPVALLFDLLLEVEHLPLHALHQASVVSGLRGPPRQETFTLVEEVGKVVPFLEPGVPAPPRERQRSARLQPEWGTGLSSSPVGSRGPGAICSRGGVPSVAGSRSALVGGLGETGRQSGLLISPLQPPAAGPAPLCILALGLGLGFQDPPPRSPAQAPTSAGLLGGGSSITGGGACCLCRLPVTSSTWNTQHKAGAVLINDQGKPVSTGSV